MKKIITLSIISSLMLCFYIGHAQTSVFSSDFETWSGSPLKPSNWWGSKTNFATNGDSTTQVTTGAHGGAYAIKLQSRTTSAKRFSTQAVSITSGKAYYFSFWVKGHGSIRTGLYIGGGSGGSQYMYNSYITVNSSTWAQYTQPFASDTTSSVAQFIISVKSSLSDLGDIQVDDVNITSNPISTTTIYNIQYTTASSGDSPYNDSIVTTSGIVTARNSKAYFIQDGTGPWNGVYVYDSIHATPLNLAVGDLVTLTGTVSEYYNLTEISNLSALSRTSAGNTLPAAYTVTGANSKTEAVEGVLITIANTPCVTLPNTYGDWVVYDTDSTHIGNLFYTFTPTVGVNYNITGPVYYVGGQFYIEPRNAGDISIVTGIKESKQNAITIYPNPVASILTITNMNGIETIRISNILGETMENIKVSKENATINVSQLSKGIYFISLFDNNGIIESRKFVKE